MVLKELDTIKAQLDEARCAYANLTDIRNQYVALVNEVVGVNATIDDMVVSDDVKALEKPYDNCKDCKCTDPVTCRKCASMADPESDIDMEDIGEEYDYGDCDDEKESDPNSNDEELYNQKQLKIALALMAQMPPVPAPVVVPPQMPQVNVPDDIDLSVGDVEIDPSVATGDITEVRDITINVGGDIIVDSYNDRNSRNN